MAELALRADLWVIAAYLAGMMLVGWLVSSGNKDAEGYAVGNRSVPGWLLGLSVLGTFTSSITFLSLPAKTYQDNWNVYVFGLALPISAWIAVRYFVPLYRREVRLSAFEFLEARFGYWARLYADLSYVVLQMIRTATIMLLVALAVRETLRLHEVIPGLDIIPTLILLGVVVIVYDTVGGIKADIWTDAVQVFVLVLGAVWALAVVVAAFPGGPLDVLEAVPAERFSLGKLFNWDSASGSWDWSQATVLVVLLYGITENLRNYGTDQNYVQRFLAAESQQAASRSIWIGALGYLPVSAVVCMIGTGLYVHYQLSSGVLPPGIRAEEVFPHFMATELPAPLRGLLISAILAAAMSTIDSSLNSVSTLVLVDVVERLPGRRRVPEIVVLRLSTVGLGVLGTGTAVTMYLLFREQSRAIMDMWWQYAGTAGGGMFGLFLLAWLAPRLPAWGAALGVLSTVPVLAWGTFCRDIPADSPLAWMKCPLHPFLVGISGTATLLLVGAVILVAVRLGLVRANPRAAPRSG